MATLVCANSLWTVTSLCPTGQWCALVSNAPVCQGAPSDAADTAVTPAGDAASDPGQVGQDAAGGDSPVPVDGVAPDDGVSVVDLISPGDTAGNGDGTGTTADTADTSDTGMTGDTGAILPDSAEPSDSGGWDASTADAPQFLDGSADTKPDSGPDSDAISWPQQCCKDKGAECGFVAGCPQACGACNAGQLCSKNKCVAKASPLKKLGEACGPSKACVEPGSGASQSASDAYLQCLNNQCDSGMCWLGVCTKACTIAADNKNNATGLLQPGGDGIEDPGAVSECGGFADGPAGSSFACVQLLSPSAPQQLYRCLPGTNFAPCKANSDCAGGEVCGYKYIRGAYALMCMPPYKEVDGKPGQIVGAYCNDASTAGVVATCKNFLCLGVGCVDFCKSDSDCTTAPGACQAGKCANSGASCSSDTDCSAFYCKKDQAFFGANGPLASVCQPKSCYLDEDCKDPNSYCLSSYNQVKNQNGDIDPLDSSKVKLPSWNESLCVYKAPGTAKKGQACDDFPADADTSVPPCENKYWCMNGVCGNHCLSDANCAAGMKCSVVEIPLDMSVPLDGVDDVYTALKVCTPMPGATGTCTNSAQCVAGKASYCRVLEVDQVKPTAATGKYTLQGQCVEPSPQLAGAGGACGAAVGKGCQSGFCLSTSTVDGQPTPGYCADTCSAFGDCPAQLSLPGFNDQKVKTFCRSMLYGHNATPDPLDDVYVPLCIATSSVSSLADCSSEFKCASANEACTPMAIATGADMPAKVEFRCIDIKGDAWTPPSKKVGAACNPNLDANAPEECVSGMCMPDASTGKGYCSSLCKSDSDCGISDGIFCDTQHQIVPRKDPAMAALAPMCLKKKSCIPCAYDYQCSGSYQCTWSSAKANTGRCAPSCSTDADCAKTDGGGKCEFAKDLAGKPTSAKVCTPLCF